MISQYTGMCSNLLRNTLSPRLSRISPALAHTSSECGNRRHFSTAIEKNFLFTPEGRVLIVGGGVGGLTLAIALRQRGISCDVIDTGRDISARDNGLFLNVNATGVLKELGLYDTVAREAQEIQSRVTMSDKGTEYGRVNYGPLGASRGVKALGIHRQTLLSILTRECAKKSTTTKAHINTSSRVGLTAMEPIGTHSVRCRFTGGRVAEQYDVVVGADGHASRVRSLFFKNSEFRIRSSPQIVASAVVERPFVCEDNLFVEMWGHGQRLMVLPINNNKLYLWGTFRSKMPAEMLKDGERDIAEFIAQYQSFAGNVPHILYALERTVGTCKLEASHEIRMKKLVSGPVALIGDAAHVMPPNIHQGAALALEDALALARTLADPTRATVGESLEAYDTQRQERVKYIQDLSWALSQGVQEGLFKANMSRVAYAITLSSLAQKPYEKRIINFK